jgi:hypothetical protein
MNEEGETFIVYVGDEYGPRFQVFAENEHAACADIRHTLSRIDGFLKAGSCYARRMGEECIRCKGKGGIAFPGMGDGICPTCEGRGRY